MTSATLGGLVLLAITAALSPFSLVAFSLVLATDRGARNGLAFIGGWITTIGVIAAGAAALGGSVSFTTSTTPGKATLALEVALGVVTLAWWLRRRVRPSRPEVLEPEPEPAWQRRVGTMGSPGAFALGALVQPWTIVLAAVSEILRAGLGPTATFLWLLAFAVATTAAIVVLEVLALRAPGSAAARLDRLRAYIDGHRNSVINWSLLVAGAWLVVRGVLGLAS